MEVIILKDYEQMSQKVAARFKKMILHKPEAVLGLATGGTPRRFYEMLCDFHVKENLDFAKVKVFNLDEYLGLSAEHPASYAYYMQENLFSQVNLHKDQCFIPNGMTNDVAKECQDYEALIKEHGPVDLQVLGIGRDGHIGFNEPVSSLSSRTRIKTLTEQTRQDNAKYFSSSEQIPLHVITMGIATILQAQEIILMASGQEKAQAIAKAVEGPLTAMVPASVLQTHQRAKVIIDESAASQLTNKDYYQWVYENKPNWQKKEFL